MYFKEPQLTDIRTVWEEIRGPISFILREIPFCKVVPEDIYSECVNDRAQLYVSSRGFMVLSIDVEPFSKTRSLLIWIAHVHETGKHNWKKHVEWLNQIAKAAGCEYIKAQSVVPEMEPYALANGWSLTERVYMREV
tara:strand:+ start:1350 stop:1760 length:411 start_codon:yes stop_codon:yes gene_type:complete